MNIIEARELLDKVIDIVFADEFPEDKEDELIELLRPYIIGERNN